MKPVLVGAVLYRPESLGDLGHHPRFLRAERMPHRCRVLHQLRAAGRGAPQGPYRCGVEFTARVAGCAAALGRQCRAIAMRDTDRDRVSHIVVRSDGPVKTIADLKNRSIAVGASDSPQATLIPLGRLLREGLTPDQDVTVRRFNVLVGKHGDHVGGERDALECLAKGETDASAMLDLNWDAWTSDGTVSPASFRILATTDKFDHCVFTVRQDFPAATEEQWLKVLFSMSYDNPEHRQMMDMEGLKAWQEGRVSGFGPLAEATEKLKFWDRGTG